MNKPRTLMLFLLLLQGILTGIFTDTRLFPLVILLLALLAYIRPISVPLSKRQRLYGLLALGLFFTLKMRFFPMEFEGRFSPFPNNYELNYAAAQGLLLLQLFFMAWTPPGEEKSTSFFSLRYLFLMTAMAQFLLISDFVSKSALQRWAGLIGAGLFTLVFSAYIYAVTKDAYHIRGSLIRLLTCVILLCGSIIGGGFLAHTAGPNVMRLDAFFFQLIRPSIAPNGPGISERSTLQSISSTRGLNKNQVALRIKADSAPSYLRVRAFDLFDGRSWQSSLDASRQTPNKAPQEYPRDVNYFILRPENTESLTEMAVWPAAPSTSLITTINTYGIGADLPDLYVDPHDCCKVKRLSLNRPYRLLESARNDRTPPDAALRESYLQIPDSLSSEARARCLSVLEGAKTTDEKIRAVIGYFSSNYTYKMGITIPQGQDAISYFLLKQPPAHCEYFAAATALMLRLAGVPCRYTIGFALAEKNTAGGYWVARNRDAHAWVEAWSEEHGWIIVEATPAGGLPDNSGFGRLASLWDVLKFRLGAALAVIRKEGYHAITITCIALGRLLVATLPGRLILLTAALLLSIRFRKRLLTVRRTRKASPEDRQFAHLLARMDRQARRRGFIRPPHQTLKQFASHIRDTEAPDPWHIAAAEWYETCSRIRFDGTPADQAYSLLNNLFLAMRQADEVKKSET